MKTETQKIVKERFALILYTLHHKKSFLKTEKELLGHNTVRGFLHDTDKLFLYMMLWMPKEKAHEIHRARNPHHVKCQRPKKEKHLVETVIDWESNRRSKEDKQLTAIEVLMKIYPEHQETYLPVISRLLPHQTASRVKRDGRGRS